MGIDSKWAHGPSGWKQEAYVNYDKLHRKILFWQLLGIASLTGALICMASLGYYQIRAWQLEYQIMQIRADKNECICDGRINRSNKSKRERETDKKTVERYSKKKSMLDVDPELHPRWLSANDIPVRGEARKIICTSDFLRTAYRQRC